MWLHINTGKPLAHTHMMYSNRTVCVCVYSVLSIEKEKVDQISENWNKPK